MDAPKSKEISNWLLRAARYQHAELEIWRKRYPMQAIYVAEEARAKVDGRKPNYPPPICIGTAS